MIDKRLPAQFDTLGLHTANPWSVPALRLLFANPRTYTDLVDAWSHRYPNVPAALARLRNLGFATRQNPVIIDTRTGLPAATETRVVPRYRVTKKGRKLAAAGREDPAVLQDLYPRMAPGHAVAVANLLAAFNLRRPKDDIGLSISSAATRNPLSRAVIRWWVARWVDDGILTVLPYKIADVREVIPAHWRPTAALASHLRKLVDAFPNWNALAVELGVNTFREIGSISATRVSDAGTTDYDHDIGAQSVFAAIVNSPAMLADATWRAEKVLRLPVTVRTRPWQFDADGGGAVSYQPDGIYREKGPHGNINVVAYEYERSQTRLEAWGHIERFLGYTHLHVDSEAVLRFVVESRGRENTYVGLVDAYGDYLTRHPQRRARTDVRIEVSSKLRLQAAADALQPTNWHRVSWPGNADGAPTVHSPEASPAHDYF